MVSFTSSINPSKALAQPGVIDYVGVDDVPGDNRIHGEDVFASGKVNLILKHFCLTIIHLDKQES